MQYLGFDRRWKKKGRVLETRVQGPHFILKLENETLQILYQSEYDSIKVNDWVALSDKNQLIKVASSISSPLIPATNRDILRKWSQFLHLTRIFFDAQNFLELHTPTLVVCPGTEPTLDVFSTELKVGKKNKKIFLPTSPELHLKKSLSMGFEKIYEIAKCYRNNEITPLHQPEFWMLEWYRSFANIFDLQADVAQFIFFLCNQIKIEKPKIQCFTVRQLFKIHLDFILKPDTSMEELKALAIQHKLRTNESFTIDDLFFLLMIEKIEPFLPQDSLVFVEKYPPFQAALARQDHEGWAERFEVYWKGMELANAFDELNDPFEQRNRAQLDLKKRSGVNPIHLDEEFFRALESGMPPSAGIALGLERLFMAIYNIKTIEKLRLFPVSFY